MSDERFSGERFNRDSHQYDPDIAWRRQESDTLAAECERRREARVREINSLPEPKRSVCPGCGESTRHNPFGDTYQWCPWCGYDLRNGKPKVRV